MLQSKWPFSLPCVLEILSTCIFWTRNSNLKSVSNIKQLEISRNFNWIRDNRIEKNNSAEINYFRVVIRHKIYCQLKTKYLISYPKYWWTEIPLNRPFSCDQFTPFNFRPSLNFGAQFSSWEAKFDGSKVYYKTSYLCIKTTLFRVFFKIVKC